MILIDDIPRIQVDAQLVDKGGNIFAACVDRQRRLLYTKHGCCQDGDVLLLQLTTGLDSFPYGWDFDADTTGVKPGGELLEV